MSDNPQVKLDTTNSRVAHCESCQYFYSRSRPDVLRRLFPLERCGYYGCATDPGDHCDNWEARPESTPGA